LNEPVGKISPSLPSYCPDEETDLMSANTSDVSASAPPIADKAAAVPKTITNAQTVCNEKNEKGKLCNGHLKQLSTAGEAAEVHLRGDDVLFKCQVCGTLYMGPPLGHLRDPDKQHRFVQAELTALLQAAGGTMPVIKKNAQGAYVLAEALADAHAPAKPAAAKTTAPVAPADSSPEADTHRPAAEAQASTGQASAAPLSQSAASASPVAAPETAADLAPDTVPATVEAQPTAPAVDKPKPAARKAGGALHRGTYAGFEDTGPVAGESFEEKIARLTKLAAAAKQKSEEGG
jgi:hypothetical protein